MHTTHSREQTTPHVAPKPAGVTADPHAPDSLDLYLGDVGDYALLDREQELAIAREIEQMEIAHWRALLGSAVGYGLIAEAVTPHFPPPKELVRIARTRRVARAELLDALALELRELDVSRVALADADAQVRAAVKDAPEHAAYRTEVHRALRAQQVVKHRLVTANLRLVVALARRYTQGLLSLGDLVQEGNLGLLRAVDRFDHRRGLRFSTYAVWWIRHAFNRALSDRGRLVRVPVHALEDRQRIARASRTLFARHGRAPTLDELAEETKLAPERITPFTERSVGRDPLSLDRPLGDDGEATMIDLLPGESEDPGALLDATAWHGDIRNLLEQQLSPIEADILRQRFGFDDEEELTLREIGEKYALSRERIRQLQEQALTKLRRALSANQARFDESAA